MKELYSFEQDFAKVHSIADKFEICKIMLCK